MLDDIDWDDISIETLRSLVESKVPESERLDYKREVYGKNDNREIAKDISALANTQGGHLVLGIADAEGEPTEIVGLDGIDPDAEVRRLDEVLRTSVRPSITGVRFKPIRDGERLAAIVVRVPKSWRAPHQVVANSTYRFYGRRARSNAPLDVDALRALFALGDTISDRLRRFREERIALVCSRNTPSSITGDTFIVWHAIPLEAFDVRTPRNLEALADTKGLLLATIGGAGRTRWNVDGLLAANPSPGPGRYAQAFRNGAVEVVLPERGAFGQPHYHGDPRILGSVRLADDVIAMVRAVKQVIRAVGAQPPVTIFGTLLGMREWRIAVRQTMHADPAAVIDRDPVFLPDHMLQTLDGPDDRDAKPILDMIWQAAGWPDAAGFDADGRWTGRI